MNSAIKVGEIFATAGAAFDKLGELTSQLHPNYQSSVCQWTPEEIEMLREVVADFAEGLQKLSEHIRLRTVAQIRNALRKRAFEEAGLPVAYVPPTVHYMQRPPVVIPPLIGSRRQPSSSSESEPEGNTISKEEMTLNMLNAPDSESDIDDFNVAGRLQFDSSNDGDDII